MTDAGRVIAGSARGIRLAAPGTGTRPLSDRVKQTLFAVLEPELADAVVADLYAGSGAGAIEALSRGAARAVLVEKDAGACRVITENLRRTSLQGGARVVRRDVATWLTERAGAAAEGPFDLVLVDPPYADTDGLVRALELVGPHVRDGGTVVAKHFWRDEPPARIGLLASERQRRFGETALTFYRRESEDAPQPMAEEADGA
jgi:16S rRNA (guanine966-N2)-methyltransferase